jgi:OOP family OmpA-OmpF porin
MNLNLSQARANAVLFELQRRRILTKNIVAKGYGETRPIASNGTEQGREQNRRIEFKHIDLSLDANVSSED